MKYRLRRLMTHLALLGAVMSATACYKASFIHPKQTAGQEHEQWTDFFLFGLVGQEEIDVRKFCQGEPARLRTGGNLGTGLVGVLTIGIYTPRKVYVTCAAGTGQAAVKLEVEVDESGAPVRVTRRTGAMAMAGTPVPVPGEPATFRVSFDRSPVSEGAK